MTKDEALVMAMEFIEDTKRHDYSLYIHDEVIKACKRALEQPAQEPVTLIRNENGNFSPKHQWQGLTDDEIDKVYYKTFNTWSSEVDIEFGRAIEQALKEKNT
jgi:hypothetical protein